MEGEILRGIFSIIYISPELLLKKAKWKEMLCSDLFQQRMVGFIVDEVHCACVRKLYVNFIITITFGQYHHKYYCPLPG